MVRAFDMAVASLSEWISARKSRTSILFSGGGAAGKSVLCEALSEMIGDENINRINSDAYLIDSSARAGAKWRGDVNGKETEGRLTACCHNATFVPGLNRDIKSVIAGYPVWTIEDFGSPSVMLNQDKHILMVEGIGACFSDITLFDVSVFVYCDAKNEYARRLPRDENFRGIPIEKIKSDFDLRRAQFEIEVLPRRELFNLILRSAEDFSLEVEKDELGIMR